MSCEHTSLVESLVPPRLSQSVHRDECTLCFDNQDGPLGVDVCLTCFNGGCLDGDRRHAQLHVNKSGHAFTLNVKRRLKPVSPSRGEDEEPPVKMAKLAIVEEREEDKYEHVTTLKCWNCDVEQGRDISNIVNPSVLKKITDGVMQSSTSARKGEVQAWEEEITACEHTLTFQQEGTAEVLPSGLAHCTQCDLKENLWLCLTCGSLGCGRQMWGGVGGNGHAMKHFEETKHPVCVKLGTITPEGTADIYCYACQESRIDPELQLHLSAFGINVLTQEKTEKSTTELQLDFNLKYDFSLTGEDGNALQPVFGPGLTGLANLGNSCYMASVVQTLFSLPAFQKRYYPTASTHWMTCTEPLPATCLDCQMHKLADGLLSGRYAVPRTQSTASANPEPNALQHSSPTDDFQEGVKPSGFKALVGKGHQEFATMLQQDSEEFLTYLIKVLRQHAKKTGVDEKQEPVEIFKFAMEQRLVCTDCLKVKRQSDVQDLISIPVPVKEIGKDADGKVLYEDVSIQQSLDLLTADETLEYTCPSCQKKVIAAKGTLFATFPEVLVIHAKKFQLVNWVPSKLDVPLILPSDDILVLDNYKSHGPAPGEQPLPEDVPANSLPEFNAAAMAQLEGMGFPTIRCQKALLATGNSDPEAAMEWLFAHMEDPDIDAPIQVGGGGGAAPEANPEQITMIADMGFTASQAKKALRETGNNVERAIEWLFNHPDDTGEEASTLTASEAPGHASLPGSSSLPAKFRLKAFISHKGPSVHSGHYVAHIRTAEGWVLFNDEKVVKADDESVKKLKALAYLYVFEKV